MESILNTIKKMLGIPEEYEVFDSDIIIHINSVFSILKQLGIGPKNGYMITDKSNTWGEFFDGIDISRNEVNQVESYIYLRVKLLFDPPNNSSLESYKELIKEFEYRMYVTTDNNLGGE